MQLKHFTEADPACFVSQKLCFVYLQLKHFTEANLACFIFQKLFFVYMQLKQFTKADPASELEKGKGFQVNDIEIALYMLISYS